MSQRSRPETDVLAALAAHLSASPPPGVVSVYLFGSHAAGRAHRESDVDVGVLLSWSAYPTARDRFDARLRLIADLGPVLGRRDVDLVVLNDAPPLLGRHVVTTGRRLLCADAEADHAYVREVQLRAADLALAPSDGSDQARSHPAVSPLVERLLQLRRHLDHLQALRPRVRDPESLRRDLSLHNDVLFSLLTVCQLVIDVAAELAARRGERFEDYTGAVRSLAVDPRFSPDLVRELERLPGFRNILIHEYVALDMARVVEALHRLAPVEQFLGIVRAIAEAGAP